MIQLDERIEQAVKAYRGQDAQRRATTMLECAERIGHLETALQALGTGNRETLDYFWQQNPLSTETYRQMKFVAQYGLRLMTEILDLTDEYELEDVLHTIEKTNQPELVKEILSLDEGHHKYTGDNLLASIIALSKYSVQKQKQIIGICAVDTDDGENPTIPEVCDVLEKYTPEQQAKIIDAAEHMYTTGKHWNKIREQHFKINYWANITGNYTLPLLLAAPPDQAPTNTFIELKEIRVGVDPTERDILLNRLTKKQLKELFKELEKRAELDGTELGKIIKFLLREPTSQVIETAKKLNECVIGEEDLDDLIEGKTLLENYEHSI